MARPSQKCDQRLIQAGIRLLHRKGISDITVRDLCSEADVNLGMFSYCFKTKDNFQRQLLLAALDSIFDGLDLVPIQSEDPLEMLVQSLSLCIDRADRDRDLARNLFQEAVCGVSLVAESASEHMPRYVRRTLDLVAECQRAGVIRGDVSAPLVVSLFVGSVLVPMLWSGSFFGWMDPNGHMMGADGGGKLDSPDMARLRLGIVLEGLKPRDASGGPIPAIRRLASRVGLFSDGTDHEPGGRG